MLAIRIFLCKNLGSMKITNLLLVAATAATAQAATITSTSSLTGGTIFADGSAIGTYTLTTNAASATNAVGGNGVRFNGSVGINTIVTTVDVTLTEGVVVGENTFSLDSITWGANTNATNFGAGQGNDVAISLDVDGTISTAGISDFDLDGVRLSDPFSGDYTAGSVLAGGNNNDTNAENWSITGFGSTQTLSYGAETGGIAAEDYGLVFNISATPIPEPSSAALLGLGGLALLARRKRA